MKNQLQLTTAGDIEKFQKISIAVLLPKKDDCSLSPSSTKWNNHKSKEAASWKDEFLDQHDRFRTLINIEIGERPLSPKKDSNQHNPGKNTHDCRLKLQVKICRKWLEKGMQTTLLAFAGFRW